MVDRDPPGNHEQPRPAPFAVGPGLRMPPRADQSLLQQVLGLVSITLGQSHEVTQEGGAVRLVQDAQRPLRLTILAQPRWISVAVLDRLPPSRRRPTVHIP